MSARTESETERASLGDLPVELLEYVLKQPVLDLRDLGACALVSGHLALVGAHLLRRHVEQAALRAGLGADTDRTEWLVALNNAIAVDDPVMTKVALVLGRIAPDEPMPFAPALARWCTPVTFCFLRWGDNILVATGTSGAMQCERLDPEYNYGPLHDVSLLSAAGRYHRSTCDHFTPLVRAIDCAAPRALAVLLAAFGPASRPCHSTEFLLERLLDRYWTGVDVHIARRSMANLPDCFERGARGRWAPLQNRHPDCARMVAIVLRALKRSPTIGSMDVHPLYAARNVIRWPGLSRFSTHRPLSITGHDGDVDVLEKHVRDTQAVVGALLAAGYSPDEPVSSGLLFGRESFPMSILDDHDVGDASGGDTNSPTDERAVAAGIDRIDRVRRRAQAWTVREDHDYALNEARKRTLTGGDRHSPSAQFEARIHEVFESAYRTHGVLPAPDC